MPRNQPDEGREPDDLKEGQRQQQSVGRRGKEHEDIEESRVPQRRDMASDADDEDLADEDLVEEEVDLDRGPEDQGPDA